MLIRQSQILFLEQQRMEAFKKRLETHLTEHFPENIPENREQWNLLFDKGLEEAKLYDLKTEYSITVYFNIMLSLGMQFNKMPEYHWAQTILKATPMREQEKIRRLIKETEIVLDERDQQKITNKKSRYGKWEF